MNFNEFELHEDVLNAVDSMNYQQATPIQEQAIPYILAGKDLLACAQTGTGKTAAYLIPILDKIATSPMGQIGALVLVPTRELAQQIDQQIQGLGYFVGATSIAVYGGNKGPEWDQQKRALTQGADIIIATPGRLIAHLQLGYVSFGSIRHLVLDEADRMLDMGFLSDILKIMSFLPAKRQTLMFSATMPPKIGELAKRILQKPEEVRLAVSRPAERIDQQFYMTTDEQKLPLLAHLLSQVQNTSMVLFTSRKSTVEPIVRALRKLGLEARGISSDSDQADREIVLRDFKNRTFPVLVATDVLSRGIDIDNLSHVVNYDVPRDPEDYVHRIGRTARAESKGTAITFINEHDQKYVLKIEKLFEKEVEKRSVTEELGLGEAPKFDPAKFRNSAPRNKSSQGTRNNHGGASKSRRPKQKNDKKSPLQT
ncbi:DEAD/DEAH box helicase [Dyadobacter frigoris]|uniref:DEAD/DEAH box helicase n=1 Tax=Dyadobacter frigoris TaxID=2576211 RepID=A0A4U6CZW6_9BACT|nr:DEAD/DEAH box helicase [Dyadobacter frigoris]TKT90450.1 DEAD/DEAH box helicase [Dyadobacter frigoris]GLU51424.1 RNA helicase [Dyadobacter frigoris]